MAINDMAFTPTNGLRDQTYNPTKPVNEAFIRDIIQDMGDQLRDYINDVLKDGYSSTTDNNSGSDNIGVTAITDFDGATVQSVLESIRTKLKSTTDGSSGADFINATTIEGITGSTLQAVLESLKTYIDSLDTSQSNALNAHKSSTDHDGRYYTETEINALLTAKTNLTGNHEGTWQGYSPTQTDPGIQSVVDSHTSQLADIAYEGLERTSRRAYANEPVWIDCYGDSTYYGQSTGGARATAPAPQVLENILRAYYQNTNIRVINRGVSGENLSTRVLTFDSDLTANYANVVIINHGLNDAMNNPMLGNEYRSNLIKTIQIAHKHNIIIVFETPNIAFAIPTTNVNTSSAYVDTVRQFAEIMRKVAQEYNIPLIDNYTSTEKYVTTGYEPNALVDGVHPSQELYYFKGLQMAQAFINPNIQKLKDKAILPLYTPITLYSGTAFASDTPITNSKVGRAIRSQYLRIPFYVDEPNLDLYFASVLSSDGSTIASIKLDDVEVKNPVNFNIALSSDYPIDSEMLIAKNLKQGFHMLELYSNDVAKNIAGTYIRLKKNPNKTYNQNASIIKDYEKVADNLFITSTGGQFLLTDICTSNLISKSIIAIKSQFPSESIILLNWSPQSDSAIGYGCELLIETTGLTLREYNGGIINSVVIVATDYTTSSHEFRIEMATNGLYTVYVDNISVGSATMPTFHSGYLGFGLTNAGTLNIEYIKVGN